MKTTIIDYGAGNVKSVAFACERLGIHPTLSSDEDVIRSSDRVIFPGVGHADYAMRKLHENNLVSVIKDLKQPVLGICLGMQLMCSQTEEGNTTGLGIFEDTVLRFKLDEKIPHMGWNLLEKTQGLLKDMDEYVYFVHSYYVPESKNSIAICHYGIPFSAALQKDNFYACQFHPEKSGKPGSKILERFLAKDLIK
jgi:glutamine amidotransferase